MLVIPVLGSGARTPAAKDLPDDLTRFSRLQALSIADMQFYSLLAESLAKAGIHDKQSKGAGKKRGSALALRAGNLLRRQAERPQRGISARSSDDDGRRNRADSGPSRSRLRTNSFDHFRTLGPLHDACALSARSCPNPIR
jgi:hypothetical protein